MKMKRVAVTAILVVVVLVLLSGCENGTTVVGSKPVITYVTFPSEVVADGRENPGVIGFSDPDGDVILVEFKSGSTITGSFTPDVAGQTSGAIDFVYWATTPKYYSLKVILRDSNGNSSNPYTFSFTATEAPPSIAYHVTAGQLLDEYDANEVAADMKYKGKLIAVTGYVDSINTNSFTGEPYVELAPSQEWTLITVNCYFRISQQAQLAQLNKGELITIVGVCHGEQIFSVKLEECHIE